VAFGEEKIVVGQSVIGVGASPGGNHNVSLGIISNLISQASSTATILSTNAVSADNIGGPLVDIRGKVVGLNLSIGRAIGRREVISTIDLIK
jgi:S1-C subfamily serine protease